jgi:LCP family protein required for cell wall assembly
MEEEILTEEEHEKWQEGWVKYQDAVYAYNEEILTFLIMGIDKRDDVKEAEKGTDGGQADALFLLVLNPKDESIKVIGINRNTMTDVDIYDDNGAYDSTVKAQIAIQHGFGDGMEESCEYQKKAVENLFYQLPIHGYAAINMSAISTINDAVGGVDVTVPEDLAGFNEDFVEGRSLHLMGENAFWYVKYRDTDIFGSADMRLDRQKQYLTSFIEAAKQAVHKDVSVVIDLYQAVKPQMVTDVSLDKVAYLAPILAEYAYDGDSFHNLQGETVMGEQYEEFYPDEEAMFEMILDVFYEKVQ